MKFKKFSRILPLFYLNLKVLSLPLTTEDVESSGSEDEIINVNVIDDDVNLVDIFSDDENIPTNNVNVIDDESIPTNNVDITEGEECSTKECIETSKRILGNMDTSVNPCDDFYKFACGGWMNKVDTEEINYNGYFNVAHLLQKEIYKNIDEIFKGEYKVDESLSKEQQEYDEKSFNKIKKIYNICMDYNIMNNDSNEELRNFIQNLNISENKENFKDPTNFTKLILKFQKKGIPAFVDMELNYDEKTPSIILREGTLDLLVNRLLMQSSTYVPEASSESLSAYKEYIKKALNIIYENEKNDELKVESILNISRKFYDMTQTNWDIETLNITSLNEKYPFMDWNLYIKEILEFYDVNVIVNEDTQIKLYNLTYFKKLSDFINEIDVDSFIDYIEWIIANYDIFNDIISNDFINLKLEYENIGEELNEKYHNIKYGDSEETSYYENNDDIISEENEVKTYYDDPLFYNRQKEKQQICIEKLEKLMPLSINKYFIKRNFKDNINSDIRKMVENIREAMHKRFLENEWLDEETRNNAIDKLLNIVVRVGFPKNFGDLEEFYHKYGNIEIKDFLDINLNINLKDREFYIKKQESRPMDNDIEMTPFESNINAYTVDAYNMSGFVIDLPVGFFLPPFYSSNEQDYINYGAIGSFIGHEFTHSYDDQGRSFDSNGEINDWWTESDSDEFNQRTQCLVDQYNSLKYNIKNETYNVDGEYTLTENIADSGSVATSYEAWKYLLLNDPERASKHNKKLPGLSNYTLDQLFYIAYAQSYCDINTYIMLEQSHAPGFARVNEVVSNNKHFSKTFNCPSNSPMNPENKCVIW